MMFPLAPDKPGDSSRPLALRQRHLPQHPPATGDPRLDRRLRQSHERPDLAVAHAPDRFEDEGLAVPLRQTRRQAGEPPGLLVLLGGVRRLLSWWSRRAAVILLVLPRDPPAQLGRSEEHTSELQS